MVVKKSKIICIALLAALVSTQVSTIADNNNNLVQLDLKRASNDAVDVTLFTTENYGDNVLVRKKSDNKYVILIPKVKSSGFSNSSLNGVKDLVSNIDVKTVNDTSGGYTKVTLITTKPLNINTSTQKSKPVTAEQKEYKTLIAQANAVKNNIAKQEPPKHTQVQKTEITVNKAATAPKTATTKPIPAPRINQSEKTVNKVLDKTVNNISNKQVKLPNKNDNKVEPKKIQQIKPQIELTEVEPNANNERKLRREHLAELINEVKQEKILQNVPETGLEHPETNTKLVADEPIQDIKTVQPQRNNSFFSKFKNKAQMFAAAVNNRNIPKRAAIIAGFLLGLALLRNILKFLFAKPLQGQENYVHNPEHRNLNLNKLKYNNIVNNDELSWQEKYQMYLDKSAKPVPRANNKGNYTFIKTPAEPVEVTQKRHELEKLLEEVPSPQNLEPEITEIQSEDDIIPKTIKLKAFDNHKNSLDISSRDKLKSRFKKYEVEIPLHEQNNVELGSSVLHSNPRRLQDANLDITDVDTRRIKYKPQEYIMSSLDEYFSILDKEKQSEPKILQEKMRFDLPQEILTDRTKSSVSQTNPITKFKNENKTSYLNGLIVKSGYNIDDNKGFYIVNVDGKSALVGKVKDDIFVLKKFDSTVTNPVQVRHDNANVYMVKAEGFKSLVEVNDDKMGVLIEL